MCLSVIGLLTKILAEQGKGISEHESIQDQALRPVQIKLWYVELSERHRIAAALLVVEQS
ncbi:MAG: hypothetical protein K1X78_00940 [Verrucomicrobiaceae bacterium]|nr:hypothetical protein [Verrucomicrobiaceae bacterium]